MAFKLRFLFILIIFSLFSFLFGLSLSRHIYGGGFAAKNNGIQIENLAKILPNIYHLIKNPTGVENLFVPIKKSINENKFDVPGLYSYLTKDGWVILDKNDSLESIINVNWEKIKKLYKSNCETCINSSFAAAPFNPIKIKQSLLFHLGGVLFKYNIKSKVFTAFKGNYHHSIESFQDSLVYLCAYKKDTLGEIGGIKNDAIVLLNTNNGKILYEKSIPNILLKNNLSSLLIGTNNFSNNINIADLIHVNDIQPVNKNTNFAKVGDLFLSLKHLSTIILYRPSTDSVLWYSVGPWLNQHDVDIIDMDKIGIYNNNNIKDGLYLRNNYSNIIFFDFKTKKYTKIYEFIFNKLKIRSDWGSRFEVLDNGDFFIEDTPSGMYYLISKKDSLISSKNFQFQSGETTTSAWARPYKLKNN